MTTLALLEAAKAAKPVAASLSTQKKDALLHAMAASLITHTESILSANAQDITAARATGNMSEVMLDRLILTAPRVAAMADALRALADLPDPVGEVENSLQHANGMQIQKMRVPMGVIAIIYESRPNVTADAAALCVKSGNVCVLRGGKEAIESNRAIVAALHAAIAEQGLPEMLVNLVEDIARESAKTLMQARGFVDLLIPRGGAGLIRACVEQATVPCIETGTGICHIYVDKSADIETALRIVDNAKTSRPSVCNAAEVCLVHAEIAPVFLPRLAGLFAARVELRACPRALILLQDDNASILSMNAIQPAGAADFDTEFLDTILAVKVVDSLSEAITHIAAHSTGHSECIVTQNKTAAETFCTAVDSAAVYINASTRFTDGGEFGLGCEMGISTQKLGARGPMGLREMTSYKYIIHGSGQIR